MAPMEYLGAWGTLIHEKNLKPKISCQTPFNYDFYDQPIQLVSDTNSRADKFFFYMTYRVHTEWQRPLSDVHFIMMEILSQAGEVGGAGQPLSLYLPSRAKLQCTLQRGQIHSPYFISTNILYTVYEPNPSNSTHTVILSYKTRQNKNNFYCLKLQ
jgi:hypothetical protein